MRLQYFPQKKLEKIIQKLAEKHIKQKVLKIFFFGSRVTGKGNERSDIDIGILGKKKIPSEEFYSLKEEIDEIPTLYSIDLVDFKTVSKDFRKVALEKVEEIKPN